MTAAARLQHYAPQPLYARRSYGEALSHIGRAIAVPEWESFVLARALPHIAGEDAIGIYPLAPLAPHADVAAGLERLAWLGLVSLVLVPDPLRMPRFETLAAAFDLCRPFKTHYLIDAERPFAPSKHHSDRIRRGERRCTIERVSLAHHLQDWTRLYSGLVERKTIGGAANFPAEYFEALAGQPELTAFAARCGDEIVAMTLWFAQDGLVYNHLTASNETGYANGASFALYAAAIDHFRDVGVINLGGGAGFADDPNDGLAAFKRGFANNSVEALLCGAILDRPRYLGLSGARADGAFFPAYRAP